RSSIALTALSQSARSESLNSFSVLTDMCARSLSQNRCVCQRAGEWQFMPVPESCRLFWFIKGPAAAFGIPASAWTIFFRAALVPSQRGWNFPDGQEFLWRDRGFL